MNPIKDYSTTQSAAKTVGEIQEVLAGCGAPSVSVQYKDGKPVGLAFTLVWSGKTDFYVLTPKIEACLEAMKRNPAVTQKYCTLAQAERVTWRQLFHWLQLQLAFIEVGQAEAPQLFLPFATGGKSEKTLWEMVKENGVKFLDK